MEVVIGVFGLIFGSFFNVVGFRQNWKDICFKHRSYCPNCKQTLGAFELIPIFSYFFKKGECKHCQMKIHWIYPVIEGSTFISWLVCYKVSSNFFEFILLIIIVSHFIIIAVSDIHHFIIPNILLISLSIFFISYQWYFSNEMLLGIFRAFGLFILCIFVYQFVESQIGAGDLKFISVLAIRFSLIELVWILFVSSFIGLIIYGVLHLFNKLDFGNKIPFGPFLSLASIIILLLSS